MSSEQIVEPALLNDENQIEAGELDQNNNAEEIEAAAEPQVGQNLENEAEIEDTPLPAETEACEEESPAAENAAEEPAAEEETANEESPAVTDEPAAAAEEESTPNEEPIAETAPEEAVQAEEAPKETETPSKEPAEQACPKTGDACTDNNCDKNKCCEKEESGVKGILKKICPCL